MVGRVSSELAERGHRVAVVAPADLRDGVRSAASTVKAARRDPETLFGSSYKGRRVGDDGPPVISIGQGIPIPTGPRPRVAPVTLGMSGLLEQLVGGVDLDLVHAHDPFTPSLSAAALRFSRSLNVGSFHELNERVLSTQVARPLVEVFFGRLDARTVSCAATGELMSRFFPGNYELVKPGSDADLDGTWPRPGGQAGQAPVRIVYCAREERGALRVFLRALRKLPLDGAWECVIWNPVADDSAIRLSRGLADRVSVVGPDGFTPEELVASADIVCLTSGGHRSAPGLLRQANSSGTATISSHLPLYRELVGDGDHGLQFPPGDASSLAVQLQRLVESPQLRSELTQASGRAAVDWSATSDQLEEIYLRLAARRLDPTGNPAVRKRLASRPEIYVDLHMHTDHSNDCATPVEVLLETARDRGLGAIAITDHNEISGALAAREVAESMEGIKVIVGEEVKTAEQGEVIGLFIEEKIERGMTMAETIAEIRRQGGLIYVPHPFDRLHSVPDYEHLLDIVEEIDLLEVFNPRVAFSRFNEEAERFAAKYRIVPAAGSDGHVAQALGSVKIRVHDFDNAEEFLEAMRDADIVRKHKNLVYVQALKWMQAASGQAGARKSVADPKPVKGGRRRVTKREKQARQRERRDPTGR